jgi:hypothetical protein
MTFPSFSCFPSLLSSTSLFFPLHFLRLFQNPQFNHHSSSAWFFIFSIVVQLSMFDASPFIFHLLCSIQISEHSNMERFDHPSILHSFRFHSYGDDIFNTTEMTMLKERWEDSENQEQINRGTNTPLRLSNQKWQTLFPNQIRSFL